jgi:aryl-alcohol dehydrogenase-like predicted oxidoreductase
VKDDEESINLIGKAYECGINFFGTADVYSNGESKRVLGEAIKKFNMPRSRIVIATKVFFIVNEKDVPRSIHGQGVDKEPAYVNTL